MSTVATQRFTGFTPDALQFLFDLAGNNERAWFQPRKAEYERLLKGPLEALCEALAERFEARGVPMRADPARSPFRIYRDVRFSRDRSPYKTNIGASFPWVEEPPMAAARPEAGPPAGWERHGGVGAYLHLSVEQCYAGGGMWHPEPARIAAFRAAVDREPQRVREALEDPELVSRFGSVQGERLKRMPQGFPQDHPEAELLKLKDVVFGRQLAESEVFSPDLPDILADDFAAAGPAFRFLASLPT
jgi:uncharacterized protein (TIGR02453 family)